MATVTFDTKLVTEYEQLNRDILALHKKQGEVNDAICKNAYGFCKGSVLVATSDFKAFCLERGSDSFFTNAVSYASDAVVHSMYHTRTDLEVNVGGYLKTTPIGLAVTMFKAQPIDVWNTVLSETQRNTMVIARRYGKVNKPELSEGFTEGDFRYYDDTLILIARKLLDRDYKITEKGLQLVNANWQP